MLKTYLVIVIFVSCCIHVPTLTCTYMICTLSSLIHHKVALLTQQCARTPTVCILSVHRSVCVCVSVCVCASV